MHQKDEIIQICMVSDTYFPVHGGAEVHIFEMAKVLGDLGYKITICTPENDPFHEQDDNIVRLTSIRSIRKKLFTNPIKLIQDIILLNSLIKKTALVHGHYTSLMSALSFIVAKIHRKRTVVTLHGLGTLDTSVGKSLYLKILRYISFKLADIVIGTSKEMVDVASRFVEKKRIKLITNGVDTIKYCPKRTINSDNNKCITILSMRRLALKNGVQYLVESVPFIIEHLPDVKLLVAGEKKIKDYLVKRAEELNITKYVEFIGTVSPEENKYYYEMADIVVFPSSAESTSLACLEAMSMKKVVVASSLEAFEYMLGTEGERGILVKLFERKTSDYNAPLKLDEDRYRKLANAIINVSKDPLQRSIIGENARKYVIDKFDWKVIAASTHNAYQSIL